MPHFSKTASLTECDRGLMLEWNDINILLVNNLLLGLRNMTRINLEYIQNLIDSKIEESITLDYKRELTKNNKEIAKDISAFANTSGGRIIYGIVEIDSLPNSINWIDNKGVKERIESVILTNIQPEIKGYDIYSVENPKNPSQAIFIVDIPESPDAPHMAKNKYHIRRNLISEPMEDLEVKNAIFRKGLRKALEFELKQNLELSDKTYDLIDKYSDANNVILLIPFHIEAWKAFVNSGMLFILKDKATELVEAYSIIHEINFFIDSLRYGNYGKYGNNIVTITDDKSSGGWIPYIIQNKILKLKPILQKIKFD